MKNRKASLIIFHDENNRILIQNRKSKSRWGENWGFFGGKIEKGETPKQALLRETKEELDFELEEYNFIGKVSGRIGSEINVDAYIYTSPLREKLENFNQNEGDGMGLFKIEGAKKLKFPGKVDMKILKTLQENLKNEDN